ncbi:MAG: fumarate hydratase [Victivallales bacterium]|nr:fumarate hydratase [Victivallales bacterium]
MRTIDYKTIVEETAELCEKAAIALPEDVRNALKSGIDAEKSPLGAAILADCLKNAEIAEKTRSPICQDTGFTVFFVELGSEVKVSGGSLNDALTEGTALGYKRGYLRKSIVRDPIFNRVNTNDNTPPIVHITLTPGEKLSITLAPKGGGSENMSATAMLKPSQGRMGVADFVVDTVVKAGGNPCPPVVVGVGVGGTFEKCAILAKKALLRRVGSNHSDAEYAELEKEILERVNRSGIGPQGLGGTTTALAVHIESHPCHIASLPVAVNLNCHAARHAKCEV